MLTCLSLDVDSCFPMESLCLLPYLCHTRKQRFTLIMMGRTFWWMAQVFHASLLQIAFYFCPPPFFSSAITVGGASFLGTCTHDGMPFPLKWKEWCDENKWTVWECLFFCERQSAPWDHCYAKFVSISSQEQIKFLPLTQPKRRTVRTAINILNCDPSSPYFDIQIII